MLRTFFVGTTLPPLATTSCAYGEVFAHYDGVRKSEAISIYSCCKNHDVLCYSNTIYTPKYCCRAKAERGKSLFSLVAKRSQTVCILYILLYSISTSQNWLERLLMIVNWPLMTIHCAIYVIKGVIYNTTTCVGRYTLVSFI